MDFSPSNTPTPLRLNIPASSMAREEWMVLIRLTFLNRRVSPFSILIAYRSIWLEIFAIRLIPTFSKTKGTDISQLTDKMIEEIEWK